MTAVAHPADAGLIRGMWQRRIGTYPNTTRRYAYLGIVVVATIVLYYELYISGAVAPSILQQYGMSFDYYVLILVFGNALGALASLGAGLLDRWGRANLVAFGLLATALLTLFALPNASSGFTWGVYFALVSIVEGVVLVATPALVRDYSPQVGRASAMGFWTLGPVIGSLVVTQVTSHTFSPPNWQHQFRVCGIVGLVVWAIAFVALRELSPGLRDQVMVTMRDRALIEARARRLDVDALTRNVFRSVAHPRVLASALGVSVFLAVYYTAVAFGVIYLTTVFGFTQPRANDVLNWWWGTEAVALVLIGLASDRLLVRKPFMVVGGVGTLVMTLVLLVVTGHPDTGYASLALIVALLGLFLSLAYAPWMAAFTETVEDLNPAGVAAGLAIWGLTIRTIVSLLFLVIPHAVGSVTPIVDYGAQAQANIADPRVAQVIQYGPTVQADAADPKVAPALAIIQAHPQVFAQLAQYPQGQVPPAALAQALAALGGGPNALQQLQTVSTTSSDPVAGPKLQYVTQHGPAVQSALADPDVAAKVAFLQAHGTAVQTAQANASNEWQHWLWICVAGQAIFIPLTWVLVGRWDPRRARQDELEHERTVQAELSQLGLAAAASD